MATPRSEIPGLEALASLDPAQNLHVDLPALRAKVAAKMSAEGLEFHSETTAETLERNESEALQEGQVSRVGQGNDEVGGNIVSLAARRHLVRRNWLIGLSAAAAATVVGFTGWAALLPHNPDKVYILPDYSVDPHQPSLEAAGADLIVPGVNERLAEIGDVEFHAAGTFSTHETKAPAFRVAKGASVSSGQVKQVAASLGLSGSVTKNSAGYVVKDSSGATLAVTVGELTSLTFNNPAAVKMECVPVGSGDNSYELPDPNALKTPSGKPASPTNPSATTTPTSPATPTPTPTQTLTPTPTPTETLPPAVRPEPEQPTVEPTSSETALYTSTQNSPQTSQEDVLVETGLLQGLFVLVEDDSDVTSIELVPVSGEATPNETDTPLPTPTKSVESVNPQATQSATPKPSGCVMKVKGQAPSGSAAIAKVQKVAQSLGATVLSSQAGVAQKDGLTTVSVPVKMPGQAEAQKWHAVVSSSGVASITANLGQETKVGDYTIISQAEAVQRLNDPKYGPLDVFAPAGSGPMKISGKVELVSARLTSAPIRQKDGSIVSTPVYQLTDTQSRVWTVLAISEKK